MGWPFGLFLLPCRAIGPSEFVFLSVSVLSILRGAKRCLVRTGSVDCSYGRVSAEQGFSLLRFTGSRTASSLEELVLFLRPLEAGSADSLCWLGDR